MTSLYLHVPFCRKKCPYCDFYSVAAHEEALRAYPGRLLRHLEIARGAGWRGPFDTIFFGGGTPSLLHPEEIGRVLEAAARLFGIAPDAEISLEANPGTVSLSLLRDVRACGVNRISLGLQSLSAPHLSALGRIHSPEEGRQASLWARKAGFDNLSCDLMFALPGQDLADLRRELDAFTALHPDHLSCYGLTAEEDTPFHHRHRAGDLTLPDDETFARQFLEVHGRLEDEGYGHYEISNFARPGRACRHNLAYWRRSGVLGIGAGAHSFCAEGWGRRSAVPSDLDSFCETLDAGRDPAIVLESFDRRGAMAETLYLGLRTAEGVDDAAFRGRFGMGVAQAFAQGVRQAGDRLTLRDGRWRFDPQGWLIYDRLITPFL